MTARPPLAAPTLSDIEAAADRLEGLALRTPLVRLHGVGAAGGASREDPSRKGIEAEPGPGGAEGGEIWLKLECLQPIGSFKIRGAGNALALADPDRLRARGVWTASAGNMAQGVAWAARERGVGCRVVVPERAPAVKVEAIRALGAEPVPVPFDAWWAALVEHRHPGEDGVFVHPVADPAVVAGNGTVGLEIADELGDVDDVLVPFGGGGLSCGIAAALAARAPGTRVWGCEVETAAPLSASLAAGEAVDVDRQPSFVDGIGGGGMLPDMWPMARTLLAGARVVSLERVADAVRVLVRRARVVAEGAGAAPVAAALADPARGRRTVCVVSGGNLDPGALATILEGGVPGPG